jgi:hypothetical protein
LSEKRQSNPMRMYWVFAGAAFVLAAVTMLTQWAFGA